MVGHEDGHIKLVSISGLKVSNIYKDNLEEGETLTCGAYSSSGHNFALGTSFGSIYLGNIKRDKMSNQTKPNMFLSKIDTVQPDRDHAVTSLQLTAFEPQGLILASFDNGQVRCWNSSVRHDVYLKLKDIKQGNKRSLTKEAYELSEFGETQFDIIDKFDMFENPHGLENMTQ